MRTYDENTLFLVSWGFSQPRISLILAISILLNGCTCIYEVFVVDTSSHHSPITDDTDLSKCGEKEAIPFKSVDGMSKLSPCTRLNLEVLRSYSESGMLPNVNVNIIYIPREDCLRVRTYSKSTSPVVT
uniref:Uncharacterized protein n=1 Tax=Gadus morhua TaxID=8049 RepID=A0A8C5FJD1_GADMO